MNNKKRNHLIHEYNSITAYDATDNVLQLKIMLCSPGSGKRNENKHLTQGFAIIFVAGHIKQALGSAGQIFQSWKALEGWIWPAGHTLPKHDQTNKIFKLNWKEASNFAS